jgi:colicin import membrane protein
MLVVFFGMEGPVKGKQAFLYCAIALWSLAGLTGCKNDSGAISALEELTTQLSDQVAEQNEELSSLTEGLQTCMKDLATAKGEAVVIKSSDATADVPSLEGEANVESLTAYKKALNDTLDKQKVALTELKRTSDSCAGDLKAVAAEAEAAGAAEAAEAEAAAAKKAAAKRAAAKKRAKQKKPAAAEEREAEGRPTTGTGSRYEKRE